MTQEESNNAWLLATFKSMQAEIDRLKARVAQLEVAEPADAPQEHYCYSCGSYLGPPKPYTRCEKCGGMKQTSECPHCARNAVNRDGVG